jgi:hypothetical protein
VGGEGELVNGVLVHLAAVAECHAPREHRLGADRRRHPFQWRRGHQTIEPEEAVTNFAVEGQVMPSG